MREIRFWGRGRMDWERRKGLVNRRPDKPCDHGIGKGEGGGHEKSRYLGRMDRRSSQITGLDQQHCVPSEQHCADGTKIHKEGEFAMQCDFKFLSPREGARPIPIVTPCSGSCTSSMAPRDPSCQQVFGTAIEVRSRPSSKSTFCPPQEYWRSHTDRESLTGS